MFHALVDCGAIECILPASIGEVLGIDVPSGERRIYFGLSQQSTSGFQHSIELQVTGFNHWITLDAGFIESENIMPLLGQTGFFSHYQIIFERFRYQLEVNTRENALMRGRKLGRLRDKARTERWDFE